MPDERALPTAEQREMWQGCVDYCQRSARQVGFLMGIDKGLVLAIDAERSALWALVDELAGRVEDWDDDLGAHYRRCGDCLTDWEIGETEEHCHNCLVGRARALRKVAGRE